MERTQIFVDCPVCVDGIRIGNTCLHCDGVGFVPWGKSGTPGENVVYTYEILEATNVDEYNALSASNKTAYNMILSCGVMDLSDGQKSRTSPWAMFDAESTTRANLIALLA